VNDQQLDFIQWFRDAAPYINAHRHRTFVLMLPGACLQDDNFYYIVNDIALLNSLGVRLVLVHGSRPQIDSHLEHQQLSSAFHKHLRITEAAHMTAINQAVGQSRVELEAALSAGLPNSPLQGGHIKTVSGNFVTAMPLGVIDGIDHQHTGKVRRIDGAAIRQALDKGSVVLASCLGYSLTGETFNLPYTEVAAQIAIELRADKLVAFADGDGAVNDQGEVQYELNLRDCESLLATTTKNIDILKACHQACVRGVPRAHLIDYHINGALLSELFSRDGTGTMIYGDSYETLRLASIEDVGGILELLEPLEEEGILVRRSRELLETEITKFRVIEMDGTIIACAALYPYDNNSAEIACVAVQEKYRDQGRAASLLKAIEKDAKKLSVNYVFVLTTQTAHWFIEQGFEAGDIEQLPTQKKHLYNFQRNSKVFVKSLSTT
jgi:amino-acid N-acetyltransferase